MKNKLKAIWSNFLLGLRQLSQLRVGIIDKYIIRKFIGTYFFTILLLIVVVVVFDTTEKVDDFMTLDAPISKIAFQYYVNFVPFFINQFSALITFISVIFFTSKMAYNTEIIAILSGGVSFKRLMFPYFISASFVGLLSLALSLFIIPEANKGRLAFEKDYLLKGRSGNYEELIYRQISDSTFISIRGYASLSGTAEYMVLETYDKGRIVSSLSARDPHFDSEIKRWKADKYITRTYKDDVEHLEKKTLLDTMINLSDNELGKVENYIQTLNIVKLSRFIEEQRRKGSDMVPIFEVEKYNRYAYPISAFILTLIGVSLSSRKVRGGTGLHIGIGILLCFSYILFMRFASEFAKGGVLPPVVSIWIPNVIFAIVAIYLYKKAPK